MTAARREDPPRLSDQQERSWDVTGDGEHAGRGAEPGRGLAAVVDDAQEGHRAEHRSAVRFGVLCQLEVHDDGILSANERVAIDGTLAELDTTWDDVIADDR